MERVCRRIKNEIKKLAAEGTAVRNTIVELKWKPEGRVEARALLALPSKDPGTQGRKKKLKALSRPETGLKRQDLWIKRQGVGFSARNYLLAYGFLRGMKYSELEPGVKGVVYPEYVDDVLRHFLTPEQSALLPKGSIWAWVQEKASAPEAFLLAVHARP